MTSDTEGALEPTAAMADSISAMVAEGLDPDMAAALVKGTELAEAAGAVPGEPYDLAVDRRISEAAAPFWAEGAPDVEDVLPMTLPGADGLLEARLYKPNVPGPAPIVLFLHGGGWVKGSVAACEWACRQIAARSGLNVLATSYRLAPEHPFPAARDDVDAVLDWCMGPSARAGLDHRRVLVAGASAGANLAVSACLARRDREAALPLGMALFYGVFGIDPETESHRAFGDGRFGLPHALMETFIEMYAPGGRHTDPGIDVVHADLAGLPPAWLSAAGKDVLRDDAHLMAKALETAGVAARLRVDESLAHGYTNRARMVPLARAAIDEAADFLHDQSRQASRLAAYAL
ncbi:MAG: alpha/beta hydrolase [Pseudomonadota bacterium]